MQLGTPDICDEYPELVQVAQPIFHAYGGLKRVEAQVVTLKIDKDNTALRELLLQPGEGRLIVVDVSASVCAVIGDMMAENAVQNGWKGVWVHGYVRDSGLMQTMPLGVWSLGTYPRRCGETNPAQKDITLNFADIEITTGDWFYADEDGLLVSKQSFPKFSKYFES